MFRLFPSLEAGSDGYPPEWHHTLKHEVRAQAGNRCVRCGHPYRKGEHGRGEWSPCDIHCVHKGPARIHARHSGEWEGGEDAWRPMADGDWFGIIRLCQIEAQWRIPHTLANKIGRFADVAIRLSKVTFESCDAAALVDRLGDRGDAVIYCDPPYLHSTRRGGRGWRESDYRCEMTEEDHVRLSQSLNRTAATVILSGYASDLYDELYPGWATLDFPVTCHSSNATTNTRDARVERLWINRVPLAFQDNLLDQVVG